MSDELGVEGDNAAVVKVPIQTSGVPDASSDVPDPWRQRSDESDKAFGERLQADAAKRRQEQDKLRAEQLRDDQAQLGDVSEIVDLPSSDNDAPDEPNTGKSLTPWKEAEVPQSRLHEFLDSLEGPREGEGEIIADYESKYGAATDDERKVLREYRWSKLKDVWDRRDNQILKDRMPDAVILISALLSKYPREIEAMRAPGKENFPRGFFEARAEDLTKLVNLDFVPLSPDTLGSYGENLLFRFLQIAESNNIFTYAIDYSLGREVAHSFHRSLSEITNAIYRITGKDAMVMPEGLTPFAREIDPEFYRDIEMAHLLGVPYSERTQQRLSSAQSKDAVNVTPEQY